jgi:hypothetical protein
MLCNSPCGGQAQVACSGGVPRTGATPIAGEYACCGGSGEPALRLLLSAAEQKWLLSAAASPFITLGVSRIVGYTCHCAAPACLQQGEVRQIKWDHYFSTSAHPVLRLLQLADSAHSETAAHELSLLDCQLLFLPVLLSLPDCQCAVSGNHVGTSLSSLLFCIPVFCTSYLLVAALLARIPQFTLFSRTSVEYKIFISVTAPTLNCS